MSKHALKRSLPKRIEIEDELLNSRTTILLGTNGLWAAAVGIGGDSPLRMGIGILGILLSIIWLMCSLQSWKVIKALTARYHRLLDPSDDPNDEVEQIVQDHLAGQKWRRPTSILAQWLPILFLSVWVIFLGGLIGGPFSDWDGGGSPG